MISAKKKLQKGFLITALAGAALGVFAKMCDSAPQGAFLSNALFSFGLLSSGMMLWMTVCAWLALRAKCGLHAALTVLCFLLPMLCGYYFWSACFTGYFNPYVMCFWMLLLLPAAVTAWILRANRNKAWLRVLGVLAGIAGLFCDFFVLGCVGTIPVFFGEIMLFAAICYLVHAGAGVTPARPAR